MCCSKCGKCTYPKRCECTPIEYPTNNAVRLTATQMTMIEGMMATMPNPILLKDGTLDYADVVPLLKASSNNSISTKGAVKFYVDNKDLVHKILGLLGNWILHKLQGAPKPSEKVVFEAPVSVPDVSAAKALLADPGKIIHSFKGKPWMLHEWTNGEGSGALSRKPRFDAVMAGDAVGRGTRIFFNFSPYDVNGNEIKTDDPRHDLINGGKCYVEFRGRYNGVVGEWIAPGQGAMFGPLELHSFEDNYGHTPVVKVPKDFEGEGTFELQGRILNQPETETPFTRTIRIS